MAKSLKISTKKQIERLVQFMEDDPELATGQGKFGSSRQGLSEKWEKIAPVLNSFGPPTRTGREWQRVWVHYKANLKRKLALNKASITGTGGGPYQQASLNPTEERVMEITQVNVSINPVGEVFGLDEDTEMDEATHAPSASTPAPSASTPAPSSSTPAASSSTPLATEPTSAHRSIPTPERRKRGIDKNDAIRIELLKEQSQLQRDKLNILQNIEAHLKKQNELLEKEHNEKRELRALKLEIAKAQVEKIREKRL